MKYPKVGALVERKGGLSAQNTGLPFLACLRWFLSEYVAVVDPDPAGQRVMEPSQET